MTLHRSTLRTTVAVAWAAIGALRVVQTTALAPLPHAADSLLTGLSVSLGVGLLVVLRWRRPHDARHGALAALAVSVLLVLLLLSTAVSAAAQDLPRRALFGAQVLPVSDDLRTRAGLPAEGGVLVGALTPGAPASEAGVQSGDVILAVDGQPVPDPVWFVRTLKRGAGGAWTLRFAVAPTTSRSPSRSGRPRGGRRRTTRSSTGRPRPLTGRGGGPSRACPRRGPFPAALLVGGVGCYSLDQPGGGSYGPYFDAFTKAGHACCG